MSTRTSQTVRRAAAGLAAAVVAIALAACAEEGGAEPDAADESFPLTVATSYVAGFAPPFIAESEGIFEEAGLDVELTRVQVPADTIPTVIGGHAQFGGVNLGAVAAAAAQGLPIVIVAPTYYGGPDSSLVVAAGSGIDSVADLRGKKISVSGLGNPAHGAVLEALAEEGIGPDEVEIVVLPVAETPAALRSGQVDAAQVTEPTLTAGGEGLEIIEPEIFSPYGKEAVLGYWVTSEQFFAEHPDVVEAFARSIDTAAELAQSDDALVRRIVQDYAGVSPEVAAAMTLANWGTDLKLDNAQQQIEVLAGYGFLDEVDIASLYFGNR